MTPRKALPNAKAYLPVGTKLAGYDQMGTVLVRYIYCHGNFAYALCRRKGVEATKDIVVSRRTLKTQRMGMAGIIQMWLYDDFVAVHQAKLLRDALWKVQRGDITQDQRLSTATLAAIAADLRVVGDDLVAAITAEQEGELVYDRRITSETLALIAADLKVPLPPLDLELARHATDIEDPEV